MLFIQFFLYVTLASAAACKPRDVKKGSVSNKAAVQPIVDGAAANPASNVPANSGGVSDSTSDKQTTGQEDTAIASQADQGANGATSQGGTKPPGQGAGNQLATGASKKSKQQVAANSKIVDPSGGAGATDGTEGAPPNSGTGSTGGNPSNGGTDSTGGNPADGGTGSTGGYPASSASTGGGGKTASFTFYGAGDSFGSGSCNVPTTACGFYTQPGYLAAVSQSLFGVGPGAGAGPVCGQCFKLTPDAPGSKGIVVKVNNLCPADGNPLCAAPVDVNVNFDLCKGSGAADALFGDSGTGQINGTYASVPCTEWSGGPNIS